MKEDSLLGMSARYQPFSPDGGAFGRCLSIQSKKAAKMMLKHYFGGARGKMMRRFQPCYATLFASAGALYSLRMFVWLLATRSRGSSSVGEG